MTWYDDFKSKVVAALQGVGPLLERDPACTFSLYEDTANGVLAAALDTQNNSLLHAKRRERRIIRELRAARQLEDSAALLPTFAASRESKILCYNPSFSQMKHVLVQGYFHQLVDHATLSVEVTDRFLTILDEVVESRIFESLTICSPFRIGISSWESEDLWVTSIINWPGHIGPRV